MLLGSFRSSQQRVGDAAASAPRRSIYNPSAKGYTYKQKEREERVNRVREWQCGTASAPKRWIFHCEGRSRESNPITAITAIPRTHSGNYGCYGREERTFDFTESENLANLSVENNYGEKYLFLYPVQY